MNQDTILLQLLCDAGLDDKESRVYLAMLEVGHTTVHDIAKIAGLKRPIIYVILDDLIKKGFASVIPNKKIKTYQAIDPGAVSAQMQTAAKNFSEMLPIFKTLANRGSQKPKISYFDTKEGIQKIYAEINRQKSAVFIASNARLNQHFPGASAGWQRSYETGFNKLVSRTIVPDHPEDIKIAKAFLKATEKVKIRTLSVFDECNMDIAVYGNKLAITTFEETPFLVIIESAAVPTFFLPIFEILWKTAKEIK
jgi:sugar-specific transcriptional regulator TrmB